MTIAPKQKQFQPKKKVQLYFNVPNIEKTCKECGMSYLKGSPEDLKIHKKFHSNIVEGIPFKKATGEQIEAFSYKDLNTSQKAKLNEALSVVCRDLGAAELSDRTLNCCKFFIYLKQGKIIGLCVVEPVDVAYKLVGENSVNLKEPINEVKMGVNRIWINRYHRRKGIGLKILLNVVKCLNIPRSELAFTQTTESGDKLARKFIGSNDYLIYVEDV